MSESSASKIIGPDAATLPERSRLSFDLDVDIAVVGAGLAGLTVALEAARLGASVAVLEGRHVGWNASGHQLGTVMPGYGLPIGDLIARIGFEDTRELWALSREGAEYVRANATEELMPGIALSEGALEVSNVEIGDELIARLQMLGEDFETEVEGWQVDRVRAELRTDHYFHGVYYPKAFQIDGRKYVHGLAALARRAGARIFEDTPVVSIDPSGIRKRIVTPSARLRASHIVLAGNIHLGAPLRRLSETLLPVWRHAAVTAPLGERLAETIAFQGSVTDSDGIDHFRVVEGDRLMWSSPETTWAANPARFAPAIARRIRTIFPQLGAGRDIGGLERRDRADRARHAADRPVAEGIVGRQRLRPPGPEHDGDGRPADRPQHPVGRRALAAVLAVRTGLGGRADRPGRRTRHRDVGAGTVPPPPVRSPATGNGRGPGSACARRGWRKPIARPAPGRRSAARRRASRVRRPAPPPASRRRRGGFADLPATEARSLRYSQESEKISAQSV